MAKGKKGGSQGPTYPRPTPAARAGKGSDPSAAARRRLKHQKLSQQLELMSQQVASLADHVANLHQTRLPDNIALLGRSPVPPHYTDGVPADATVGMEEDQPGQTAGDQLGQAAEGQALGAATLPQPPSDQPGLPQPDQLAQMLAQMQAQLRQQEAQLAQANARAQEAEAAKTAMQAQLTDHVNGVHQAGAAAPPTGEAPLTEAFIQQAMDAAVASGPALYNNIATVVHHHSMDEVQLRTAAAQELAPYQAKVAEVEAAGARSIAEKERELEAVQASLTALRSDSQAVIAQAKASLATKRRELDTRLAPISERRKFLLSELDRVQSHLSPIQRGVSAGGVATQSLPSAQTDQVHARPVSAPVSRLPAMPVAQKPSQIRGPERWKKSDFASGRSVRNFFSEVRSYFALAGLSTASSQALAQVLKMTFTDNAVSDGLEEVRQFNMGGDLEWDLETLEKVMMAQSGELYRNPKAEAITELVAGVHQRSNESVAAYGVRVATLTTKAGYAGLQACMAFAKGLLPDLRKPCATQPNGAHWENLTDCIQFAQGEEQRLAVSRALAPHSRANSVNAVFTSNRPQTQKRDDRGGSYGRSGGGRGGYDRFSGAGPSHGPYGGGKGDGPVEYHAKSGGSGSPPGPPGAGAVAASRKRPHDGPALSDAEKEERKRKGLCFRCPAGAPAGSFDRDGRCSNPACPRHTNPKYQGGAAAVQPALGAPALSGGMDTGGAATVRLVQDAEGRVSGELPPPPPLECYNCLLSTPSAQEVPAELVPVSALQHQAGKTLLFKCTVAGKPAVVLMDTGSMRTFVSSKWASRHSAKKHGPRLRKFALQTPQIVRTALDQRQVVTQGVAGGLYIQRARMWLSAGLLDGMLSGVDVILGMDWLTANNVEIQCGKGAAVVHVDGKRRVLQAEPERPDPAVAAALAECSNSIPLMLSAKQVARAIRKGAAYHLLMVRDRPPDCEEVQVAAMSTSPAPAPADLRTDEQRAQDACQELAEQIRAKFGVTSLTECVEAAPEKWALYSVRKYADVFLPPAGPAPYRGDVVGHMIELARETRPHKAKVRRFSPAESAECKRQIDEYLAKGIIRPSTSPWGSPVLFVEKKTKKEDGTPELRMCVDSRVLNKHTVKQHFPLPNIQDLFDQLQGASWFTSVDLASGYMQIRLHEDDAHKTAFITPHGQYEFVTLSFGLANAPSTFQRVMTTVFSDMVGKFVLIYLDDICIYSKTLEEHREHVEAVLQRLRREGLKAKLSKCEFFKRELHFLGFIVGQLGVRVDPAKVATVANWPEPRCVKDLQAFLGLCNYFRKFIPMHSVIAAPLTSLCSKDSAAAFDWTSWGEEHKRAFQALKDALSSAPVLAMPDFDKPFEVRTDASLLGTGGVLMQAGRVVCYTSKKFCPAETRYTTGEQELLGLVRAMQEWRCYLEGAPKVLLITDHHPLVHVQTQPNLSRRMGRWVEFLQRFHFEIKYEPGKTNVADPLSRSPALVAGSAQTEDPVDQYLMLTFSVCPVQGLSVQLTEAAKRERLGRLLRSVKLAAAHRPTPPGDALPGGGEDAPQAQEPAAQQSQGPSAPLEPEEQEAVQAQAQREGLEAPGADIVPDQELSAVLRAGYAREIRAKGLDAFAEFKERQGLYWKGDLIVVPEWPYAKKQVIEACHDDSMAGHVGITKTVHLVGRTFWWPTLRHDVEEYVRHCDACQRNKPLCMPKAGLMQPLSIPGRRWASLSMDHIVKLPSTARKHDAILTVVDRLSKYVYLIPTSEKVQAKETAELLVSRIFSVHGMPASIVSDRGSQWNNQFWQSVCKLMGIKRSMSSPLHPQTDGQAERANRVVAEMLRAYVSPNSRDWDRKLPMVQFAINNSWQESVKNTPAFLNFGQHPLTPAMAQLPAAEREPEAEQFVKGIVGAVESAKAHLAAAQERMMRYDKGRAVAYQPGDKVMINLRYYARKVTGVKKLRPMWAGPYEVEAMVGPNAVQLKLPREWGRVHNVQHVEKLKPYREPLPGQDPGLNRPPPVTWADGLPELEVQSIIGHRTVTRGGKEVMQYRVLWKGYGQEEATWEPRSNLSCGRKLREYLRGQNLSAQQDGDSSAEERTPESESDSDAEN